MKILVSGSRNLDEMDLVWVTLGSVETTLLIVGDCKSGADLFARRWAWFYQVPMEVHAADWKKYGKRAGPKRNGAMVATGPDLGIFFFMLKEENAGTKDCYKQARDAGISTEAFWR